MASALREKQKSLLPQPAGFEGFLGSGYVRFALSGLIELAGVCELANPDLPLAPVTLYEHGSAQDYRQRMNAARQPHGIADQRLRHDARGQRSDLNDPRGDCQPG